MIGKYRQAENYNQYKIATEHKHEQQWRLTISDPGNARGIRLMRRGGKFKVSGRQGETG
jgi:hypothetical protein